MTRGVNNAINKDSQRKSLTVLVLGDESVGKSSLISTFVSRHFADVSMPGAMTPVRLPPDVKTSCVTTIIDSLGGHESVFAERTDDGTTEGPTIPAGIGHADSIVLVYDLSCEETFRRLETHWLPLIERCKSGTIPVILTGNKNDLYVNIPDDDSKARSRQRIVSLLQRFKFVQEFIKCSAKEFWNVDELFSKAQQAVLYPFSPLYDLNTGSLTIGCRKALTRIFRLYDKDNDGLLSNSELTSFQNESLHVPLVERDLVGWKKVVARNSSSEEAVVRNRKFTVAGFIAIFDVFITNKSRLDVPWHVLRKFGYDDDLNLHIPTSVVEVPEGSDWRLSYSARTFLAAMFHQFDKDNDGILSSEDINAIFSVLPEPALPPWHPLRARALFRELDSLPKMRSSSVIVREDLSSNSGHSLSASGITIMSAMTFPTFDGGGAETSDSSDHSIPCHESLSFLDWIGYWHLISSISPSVARTELFRIGHIEHGNVSADTTKKRHHLKLKSAAVLPEVDYSKVMLPSEELRVLVVGSKGCGKTALLNSLCDTASDADFLNTSTTETPESTTTFANVKRRRKRSGGIDDDEKEYVIHLIFTEVPQSLHSGYVARAGEIDNGNRPEFDLVLFAFDSKDSSSLDFLKTIEHAYLTEDTPRLYLATKIDLAGEGAGSSGIAGGSVVNDAIEHCRALDLEAPLMTSAAEAMLLEGANVRSQLLERLAKCALGELRTRPHAERRRKEAANRRRLMWIGGIVSAAVVVGVGMLLGKGKSPESKGRFCWFRSLFGGKLKNK